MFIVSVANYNEHEAWPLSMLNVAAVAAVCAIDAIGAVADRFILAGIDRHR